MTTIMPVSGVPSRLHASQFDSSSADDHNKAFSVLLQDGPVLELQTQQRDDVSGEQKSLEDSSPMADIEALVGVSRQNPDEGVAKATRLCPYPAEQIANIVQTSSEALTHGNLIQAELPEVGVLPRQQSVPATSGRGGEKGGRQLKFDTTETTHKTMLAEINEEISELINEVVAVADPVLLSPQAITIPLFLITTQNAQPAATNASTKNVSVARIEVNTQSQSIKGKALERSMMPTWQEAPSLPAVLVDVKRGKGIEKSAIHNLELTSASVAKRIQSSTIFTIEGSASPTPQASAISVAADASPISHTERTLDLAREDVWLDQLAKDIVSAGTVKDRLSFRLSPPHLGQLDVGLSHSEAGVRVQMTAAHDGTRQILASVQPRLVDEMRAQGLRVAETQVLSEGFSLGDRRHGRPDNQAKTLQIIEIEPTSVEHVQSKAKNPNGGRFA
jgi:Flagellar hook-length control protein FliK